MAVSQTLTVTEVSGSVNTTDNTSKVRILWKSTQTGESWNGYERTAKYYVSINGGAETEYSVSYTLPKSATKTIVDTTITVNHKGDGTGTVKVRTWMDTGISAGVVEKARSLILTTIPRASTIDSLSSATKYFDGTLTYKYTPKSAGYYNRCNITLALDGEYITVKTVYLGKQTASQKTATVTFTASELATIYKELPKTTKGILRFTFRTYSDAEYSDQIGEMSYKEITLYIPDTTDTKPTATMTVAPVSSLAAPFNSLYIKGRTKVDVNFTGGAGKHGASIVSYEMSVGGKSYGSPYTSGYLSTTGTVTVKGIVTDSRGLTREYTQNITVIDYAEPKILPASGESAIVCTRCYADGTPAEDGKYLRIRARRSYSKVTAGGVQKNYCAIRYRYRPESTNTYSSWVTLLARTDTADTVDSGAIANVVSSAETTYFVQVGVVDDVGATDAVQITVPTDFVTIDCPEEFYGRRMGIFRHVSNTTEDGLYMGLPIFGGSVDSLLLGTRLTATATAPISLDDIKTPGCYYSPNAENSLYMENAPYKDGGFGLEVRKLQHKDFIRQTIYYGRTTIWRHYNGSEWSDWVRVMVSTEIDSPCTDFVIEHGTKNGWTYKKWKSKTYEMFGEFEVAPGQSTLNGTMYRTGSIAIPGPFTIESAMVSGTGVGYYWISNGGKYGTDAVNIRIISDKAITASTVTVRLHVVGTYA